jgi:hypothetical protein
MSLRGKAAKGGSGVKASLFIVLLMLAPAAAGAQVAPPPPSGRPPVGDVRLAPRATTVDEITILPRATCLAPKQDPDIPPPKIVSTFPAPGDVVRPGLLVVRLTFDRPMSCDGFLFSDPTYDVACPRVLQDMLLSLDRRTIRTICHVPPVTAFSLWVNGNPASGLRPNLKNQFISLAGWPAEPKRITFLSSNDKPARTLRDALLEDPTPGIAGLRR